MSIPPPPPANLPLHTYHHHHHSRMASDPAPSPVIEFNWKKAEPGDFMKVNWKKAKNVFFTDTGSAGVFFVQTEDDKIVIVKGSSTVVQDLFATEFAKLVDVHTAEIRVVQCTNNPNDHEWEDLKRAVMELAPTVKQQKIEKELDRPYLFVMEFVRGYDLSSLPFELAEKYFSSPKSCVLSDIGRILAMDLVLNNWDRLPCSVWRHEGNPSNILFQQGKKKKKHSSEGKDIIHATAIDQAVTCIIKTNSNTTTTTTTVNGYEDYMNRVREYLANTRISKEDGDGSKFGPSITDIRDYIKQLTLYDVGEEGMQQIYNGLAKGVKDMARITENDIQKLKDRVNSIHEANAPDHHAHHVWAESMKHIDVGFICDVLEIFREFAQRL